MEPMPRKRFTNESSLDCDAQLPNTSRLDEDHLKGFGKGFLSPSRCSGPQVRRSVKTTSESPPSTPCLNLVVSGGNPGMFVLVVHCLSSVCFASVNTHLHFLSSPVPSQKPWSLAGEQRGARMKHWLGPLGLQEPFVKFDSRPMDGDTFFICGHL